MEKEPTPNTEPNPRDTIETPHHESASDSEAEILKDMASLKVAEDAPLQYKGTGFIYDDLFSRPKCEFDPNYPEKPERVLLPLARNQELGLIERCVLIPISYATEDQILWQHTISHLELAKETAKMTPEQRTELAKKYDAWYSNEVTFESSLAAAGSSIALMDQILQKKITNGFAMVRPPGHHAMNHEFCGYCTFNNAALAASYALNHGVERVLIVDWDVHHGQASQYMFYDDPRVMYFSIHRYGYGTFWPHLRESDYDFIGEGKGEGYNINVPLNQIGMGDSEYLAIFQQLLMPMAYEFSPQVVIVSSGYDAAIGCIEGEMMVTPAAYAHFIHLLSGLCEGRLCTLLEGGYCLQSLAEGCALTLRSLLRDPCPKLPPMKEPADSVVTSILNCIKVLQPFWHCFDNFETLTPVERCPFDEVNTSPPKDGVIFTTVENKPKEYNIMEFYPTQTPEIIADFARQISQLIAETSLVKAPHKTCFVFDAEMRKHQNLIDKSHPERPNRISCIFEKHREWGLLSRCLQLESRLATEEEILRIHDKTYLELLKQMDNAEEEAVQDILKKKNYNSIYMCKDTYKAALLSAGSTLQVTEAVLSGKAQSGVAVVRPPGHHAECTEAMGFCIFNNVAVAAAFAKDKFDLKRILIVDWDVHHGNATQHSFYSDPSVLYISLHRFEDGHFFPGQPDGGHDFVGEGAGKGFNVNIPFNKEQMGNAEYLAAFQRIVLPIAYEYGPELVIVSAGFDAAAGDLLGRYIVTPEGYGQMTHMLSSLANGKIILVLEGGYCANAIAASMATCTSVLLGDSVPQVECSVPNKSALKSVRKVLEVQKQFWKSLKFAVKIPSVRSKVAFKNSPMAIGSINDNREIKTDSFQEAAAGEKLTTEPDVEGLIGVTQTMSLSPSEGAGEGKPKGGNTDVTQVAEGGAGPSGSDDGAVGGAWRPNTMADVIKMKGVDQMFAVEPRPWCPHLESVQPLPARGMNVHKACEDCEDATENWVCLICYRVLCSRFVNEHMMHHASAEQHLLALSCSDLSVWCYGCEDYVDNEVLHPMKNEAHMKKFGESIPNRWTSQTE